MAPPKGPKKALKSMEKPIDKGIMKSKKNKKKNFTNFSVYLFKLLKSIEKGANMRISRHSMLIMNNFLYDMMEKILVEAGRLVIHGKKTTLGSREIQSAISLTIPGELAKHANIEGMKAITLYHNSMERDMKSTNKGT